MVGPHPFHMVGEKYLQAVWDGAGAYPAEDIWSRSATGSFVERMRAIDPRVTGMPILGDTKYGDEGANRVFRARGLTRLFLHAASLRFRWPETGQEYHFEAPLSPELREILEMMDKG